MSNIAENLLKILTSRYGKDVRQAIHDSIETCYNDGVALDMEIEPKTTDGVNIADITINGETTKLYNGLPIDDTTTAADKVWSSDKVDTELDAKADSADLATVATSGSYEDLSNKPTIPTVNNGTLTIQQNGTDKATFSANQSGNATANIVVPTKTSDLTNDNNFVESSDLASVATSGSYEDLSDKPTIPTRTSVVVTPKVATGVNIADITIDGTTTPLYAEKGSEVSFVSLVSVGTHIADITIDGFDYAITAPSGGGSTVVFSPANIPLIAKSIGTLDVDTDSYVLKVDDNFGTSLSVLLNRASGDTEWTGEISYRNVLIDLTENPIECNSNGYPLETAVFDLGEIEVRIIPNSVQTTLALATLEIWLKNELQVATELHTSFYIWSNPGRVLSNYSKTVSVNEYDASRMTSRFSQTYPNFMDNYSRPMVTVDDVLKELGAGIVTVSANAKYQKYSGGATYNSNYFNFPTRNVLYRNGNVVYFEFVAKAKAAIAQAGNNAVITIPVGYRPYGESYTIGFHGDTQYSIDKAFTIKHGALTQGGMTCLGITFTGDGNEYVRIAASWVTEQDFPS